MATKEQVQSSLNALLAITEAIRGLKRVPSGELYSTCMGHMDLATFESFIGRLTRMGMVKEESHELIWIGPEIDR